MAHLGELTDYLEDSDLRFSYNGTDYRINPTAQQVLQYNRWCATSLKDAPEAELFQQAAILAGGTYNPEEGTFTGGVLGDLEAAGASAAQLERIATTTALNYFFGEDAAATYYASGDLGKALGLTKKQVKEIEQAATAASETKTD